MIGRGLAATRQFLRRIEPRKKEGREVYYSVKDVFDSRFDQLIGDDGNSTDLDLTKERAALTREQKIKTQLERKLLEGDLVKTADVAIEWSAMASAFRAKMLGMPSKIAHSLQNISKLTEIKATLESAISESLAELAGDGLPRDRVTQESSSLDSQAPAKSNGKSVGRLSKKAKP